VKHSVHLLGCADLHESCAAWADTSADYCLVNVYVRDNCKVSCNLCTTTGLEKEVGGIFVKGEYDNTE